MYQSDIFCLVSNQSLIIDTEISKIISLSMIIYFFIFPQIIVLGNKKRGGVNWRGAINGKNTVNSFSHRASVYQEIIHQKEKKFHCFFFFTFRIFLRKISPQYSSLHPFNSTNNPSNCFYRHNKCLIKETESQFAIISI